VKFIALHCQQTYHGFWLNGTRQFPVNSDVWDMRFHGQAVKAKLIAELSPDTFNFKPPQKVIKSTGEVIHVWTSIDSLVLKLLSIVPPSQYLPLSMLCRHLKERGGSKHTVTEIQNQVSSHTFVFRTDVKSYYESINHEILLDKLSVYVKDKQVMNLLAQYTKRSGEHGGLLTDFTQGISSGRSLGPLISSFYLYELDKEMALHTTCLYILANWREFI
jgi:hypothetical protein